MNSVLVHGAATDQCLTVDSVRAKDEQKMRRRMRLDPKTWAQNSQCSVATALSRSVLLLAGGFCLGWGAFRMWHD